ncbi:hypothetical protein EGI22_09660 [Lacihabitans sp. LS3-19]|uniref:hypothetical protein n=1 Tax=Lacihabitans sp. LS3-19 TaxID=2487335 RepID=UPI0020CDD5F1|nr:hypothetical protein [Lacihabitans sp. LS3-19]MCP9768179.1 hypothetical protein [Lacihabitans sp. LS3-19]
MRLRTILLFCFLGFVAKAQETQTADQIIDKYLEVTKIKGNSSSITDMVMNSTAESPRGVAETEVKYQFPFKFKMSMFSNGMELMSTIYDGEKLARTSTWGNNGKQEPKTGNAAKAEAQKSNPFFELEYKNNGFSATLLPSETFNEIAYNVIEFKDPEGKTWKDYYNPSTGLKDKTWSKMESPRGVFETTVNYENYKSFKGSEILFPSVKKQSTQMGEVSSELQSVKINKGLKAKDFEIK